METINVDFNTSGQLFTTYSELMETINVDFNTTGQIFTTHSEFVKYLRKSGNTMKQCNSYLLTSRNPVIQLRGRSCIKILIGYGTP
jgi:hypothetical protein